MRTVYLVTYDICDAKRLRRTFKAMRRFGDHLQLSVFRCIMNESEKIRMISEIKNIINSKEDQMILANLGPEDGRGSQVIETVGLPYVHPEKHAFVM